MIQGKKRVDTQEPCLRYERGVSYVRTGGSEAAGWLLTSKRQERCERGVLSENPRPPLLPLYCEALSSSAICGNNATDGNSSAGQGLSEGERGPKMERRAIRARL